MSTKWLQSLDDTHRAEAEKLVAALAELGCPDPAGWARRQLRDQLPQVSRLLLMKHLWAEAINPWRDSHLWITNLVEDSEANPEGAFSTAGAALARLLDDGADPDDIAEVARFVAYQSVFSAVHTLDEGFDSEREGEQPGWALVERDPLGNITGRLLAALHDELPSLEKS